VNDEVVHGIPGARRLKAGDIVSLDTGCKVNGWCGDSAYTHPVGGVAPDVQKLLDVTRTVLELAIKLMAVRSRWSEVAREMGSYVRDHGFSVVENFVGHGIGREMHEEPQVPNFISPQLKRNHDFRLETGLVIAVEPMVKWDRENENAFRSLDPGHERRKIQRPLRAHHRDDRRRPLGANRAAATRGRIRRFGIAGDARPSSAASGLIWRSWRVAKNSKNRRKFAP
jgi:methionyl aminopeptidase